MPKYFLRFANETDTMVAMSSLLLTASEVDPPYRAKTSSHLVIADLGTEEVASAKESGAEVYEDVLFSVVADPLTQRRGDAWEFWESVAAPLLAAPPSWMQRTQNDVIRQVRAPLAWPTSRGAGVTIAIVDTGIAGTMPEFPLSKRSPRSLAPSFTDPWTDLKGHGSMCASAAAATRSGGGRYDGVAPDALLLSARTTLFSSDIYKIYDQLIVDKMNGDIPGPLVISNSYGLYTCSAPTGLPQDHPYLDQIRDAVAKGIVVVFAAGNNHADVLCNHSGSQCSPNTIWAVNSIDEVITVGTVDENERNDSGAHANSSRGPGQWAVNKTKPDVVAPTYGEIVWGGGYRKMEWWGTSGACPQVAGLAALLLAVKPALTPTDVWDIITSTAKPLTQGNTCVGFGMIDCSAAVTKALTY